MPRSWRIPNTTRGEHTKHFPNADTGVGRVDHAICGTDKFDRIVRDPVLTGIHTTLAGGPFFISATYYIEKVGPAPGGGLHNGGYPVDRDIYLRLRPHQSALCLQRYQECSHSLGSDLHREGRPFAAIRGSHKATFSCPFDMSDATQNPMAVPVFAAPGDVIIFSEGMTHNAFPVTDDSIRRSVFFAYMPAISRNNLPHHRMSIYPDHVLERLNDQTELLSSPGYI